LLHCFADQFIPDFFRYVCLPPIAAPACHPVVIAMPIVSILFMHILNRH